MHAGPKTLNIEQAQGTRTIISIKGLPFYLSSGENSAYGGTWFPFFGVNETNSQSEHGIGWFRKSPESKLPADIRKKMSVIFPSYAGANAGRELQMRFYNLPGLLISSCLGGGVWHDAKGKQLKRFLKEQYPFFYLNMPKCEILPHAQQLKTPQEINQWLCQKANKTSIDQLMPMFGQSVESLESLLGFSLSIRKSLRIAQRQKKKERARLERAPTVILEEYVCKNLEQDLSHQTQSQCDNDLDRDPPQLWLPLLLNSKIKLKPSLEATTSQLGKEKTEKTNSPHRQ